MTDPVHPSERIRGTTSRLLDGKRIILAVTGSIAAVRSVELARELIRHGAHVVPVMSHAATGLVGADALEFATGVKPVVRLTGQVEHVLGEHADLLLVAPATGNTVSKMALGIDDTPVTTFFTALADKSRCVVAPAMHESMWDSPFLTGNLQRLRDGGVTVLDPFFEEGKAKLPDVEALVEHAIRACGPAALRGKRVLVINGSTVEPLDDMRVVTNKSTGRMGVALVNALFRAGADVEHWFGHGHVASMPSHVTTRRFITVDDLLRMLPDTRGFDAVLLPAAISDYGPAPESGKIPSEKGEILLRLAPLPKVVHALREHFDGVLVPFKAESQVDEKRLVEKARASVERNRAAFVVANDLTTVGVNETRVLLVDAKDVTPVAGSKDDVAGAIVARLTAELGDRSG